MPAQSQSINPHLNDLILQLVSEQAQIPESRREELRHLADEINVLLDGKDTASVIFVCTHNSRRSQLAQLWFKAATSFYQVPAIETYSGGTSATAFNSRMVDAVSRAGFLLARISDGENPHYRAMLHQDPGEGMVMFSKKYDDLFNPQKDFIAVMVCGQADHDCPLVPGAYARVSLLYEDPKAFDGTDRERQAYDEKVREIGREMLYLVSVLSSMSSIQN